jgi:NAD-dependent protein deacetylase/lipoamidase
MDSQMRKIVDALSKACRVLVFTGAGISTGSGIPDFRGPQGVWKRRKPVTIDEFLRAHESRQEYWDYKLEGYDAFLQAEPNEAHKSLLELERGGRLLGLVTQNVDGLHSRAGTSDEKLVEVHGTNRKVTCLDCGEEAEPSSVFKEYERTREPPTCQSCGGWLKPATISFGQQLDDEDLLRIEEWAIQADFVIALGSTLSVRPVCLYPILATKSGKVPYLIVNQGETDHDVLADFRLDGDLVVLVPRIIRLLAAG